MDEEEVTVKGTEDQGYGEELDQGCEEKWLRIRKTLRRKEVSPYQMNPLSH